MSKRLVDNYKKWLLWVVSAKGTMQGIKAKGILTFSIEGNWVLVNFLLNKWFQGQFS